MEENRVAKSTKKRLRHLKKHIRIPWKYWMHMTIKH